MGRLIPSGTGTSIYRGLTAVEASNLSEEDTGPDAQTPLEQSIDDTIGDLLGDSELKNKLREQIIFAIEGYHSL